MVLPAGARAILDQLYAQHVDLARGSDDQRRALTRLMAETFCARFGPAWGTKSTTAQHPPSKDALAFRYPDGTIDVYDWQNGATREVQIRDGQPPSAADARTNATIGAPPQFFIAVEPIDHLAATTPPAPPQPEPAPEPAPTPPPAAADPLELLRELLAEAQQQTVVLEGIRRDIENGTKLLAQLATTGDFIGGLFKSSK